MELIIINILTLFQVSPFCVLSRTHDKVIRDALRKSGRMENSCDEKDKDNLLEGTWLSRIDCKQTKVQFQAIFKKNCGLGTSVWVLFVIWYAIIINSNEVRKIYHGEIMIL